MGMAFKGEPETNDLRGSVSIELYRSLSKIVAQVFIFDWLVGRNYGPSAQTLSKI